MSYKLKCELFGHTSDVRSLAHSTDGQILSCSRDQTSKIWSNTGTEYVNSATFHGHSHFVSTICFSPPNEAFPSGLISTGSNDSTICCYTPDSSDVLFKLTGHKDTVCCVAPSESKNGGLLSSSWDHTVIYWDLMTRQPALCLSGHSQAVWCVLQLKCGFIITGSADKTIRVYTNDGAFVKSLQGHNDCVRAFSVVSDDEFLSTGNDGRIIHWKLPFGSMMSEFVGGSHFIYSLAYIPSQEMLVWSGESQNVYIKKKSNTFSFQVPSVTIWAITVLPNMDIVAGGSDGVIRIYTCDPLHYASESAQAAYQAKTKSVQATANNDQSKGSVLVYLNDLHGPEVLGQAGRHAGDIKIVRQGVLAVLYSWSNGEWVELGKKKGSYVPIPKKNYHKGKGCDYLFSIDVETGQPNLNLPMNLQDDPWDVASFFVLENKLPEVYTDQIVTFLINSVKSDFTNLDLPDKFTIYSEDKDNVPAVEDNLNRYFPQHQFIKFDNANLSAILRKLEEFNTKIEGENSLKLDASMIEQLQHLVSLENSETSATQLLLRLLEWPENYLFPVLDLMRLSIRNKQINSTLFSGSSGSVLLTKFMHLFVNTHHTPNQLMVLRILSNMLSHEPGRSLVLEKADILLQSIEDMVFLDTGASFQVAISTLILNLTVSTERDKTLRRKCLKCLSAVIIKIHDKEALFRLLVSIGTLISFEGSTVIPGEMLTTLKDLSSNNDIADSNAERCLNEILYILK